ncbi:hypothetical protein E2R23_32760 [Burkholderia pseudomallei]|nr:hypothetical protein E2R23_32760 [Burkholderia pseudomallei]
MVCRPPVSAGSPRAARGDAHRPHPARMEKPAPAGLTRRRSGSRAALAQEKARRMAPGFAVSLQRTRVVRRRFVIRARPNRRFPSARAPARRRAQRARRAAAS